MLTVGEFYGLAAGGEIILTCTGRGPMRLQQPQRGLQMRPSLMMIPCAVGSSGEPCVGM